MSQTNIEIRDALPHEFEVIGEIMVDVYANLEGFPSADEQPAYFDMLKNIGQLTSRPNTHLLVAADQNGKILGAVVYFSDMKQYGSGGSATSEKNAAGFRLLAVSENARGLGLGKKLSEHCIDLARSDKREQMIIHTTASMKLAWGMYERLGFKRSEDLDFLQNDLQVYGFRLILID